MKASLRFLSLIICTTLLISCGGEKKSSNVTLNVSFLSDESFLTSTGKGGVMIYGHHLETEESFAINGNSEVAESLTLTTGPWEFFAIAWSGDDNLATTGTTNINLTGDQRCSYTKRDLSQAEEAVEFNLSKSNCSKPIANNEYISHPSYMLNSQFKNLQIRSCLDLSFDGITSGTTCETSLDKGLAQSVRVNLKSWINENPLPSSTIQSRCINLSEADSSLRLPVGDLYKKEAFIELSIDSFIESNCQGDVISFDFRNGIGNSVSNIGLKSHLANNPADSTGAILFLEHNTETVNSNIKMEGGFFFGTGQDGDNEGISGVVNSYERIVEMSASGTGLKLANPMSSLKVDDEVIWYVNAEGMTNDCGPSTGFRPGMFGFKRVKSVIDNFVTFHDSIQNYHMTGATRTLPLPTNALLASDTSLSSYCSMQLIRVPNYNNISISTDTYAQAYDHSTGTGGIIIFKVRGRLTMDASSGNKYIKAVSKGFDNSVSVDYSHCSGIPCLVLGNSISSDSTDIGGGAVFVVANELNITAGSGSTAYFYSKGENTSGTASLVNAGNVIVSAKDVNINNPFNNSSDPIFNIYTEGFGSSGMNARFEYCKHNGIGVLPGPTSSAGNIGGLEVIANTHFCSY